MPEIKVIVEETQLETLTKEEREVLFDRLSADNPSIPKYHFDSFAQMQDAYLAQLALLNKPEIAELLFRKIVALSRQGSQYNTIAIPVIDKFSERDIEPRRRIKIRFDNIIISVTKGLLDYIVPINEEIEVEALVINQLCKAPMTLGAINELRPLNYICVPVSMLPYNVLISGNYNYIDIAHNCDNLFIRGNNSFNVAYTTLSDEILSALFDYLRDYELSCSDIIAAQFIHTQIEAAIRGSPAVQPLSDYMSKRLLVHLIEPMTSPEIVIPKIIPLLESIHNGRFSRVSAMAILADIDMRGFSPAYYRSALLHLDDKSVKSQIDIYKMQRSNRLFAYSVKQKFMTELIKLNTYMIIIEKKLGPERLKMVEEEITKWPAITARAESILDLLKPNERKPVELEYKRREKYLEEVLNNKCPHVKLYRRFRLAKTDEQIRKYYMELKKFFKPNNKQHMITCNNCGFDLMCPHVRDYTELDLRGAQRDMKNKLAAYIDRVAGNYYCKICGELMQTIEYIDVAPRDPASMMNEELKNFMWGEIASLIKFLKLNTTVDVPKLITIMRDACYPFIFEIEKQILKSKTNSADEIKAKKRLYVTIYAFAYMTHLIINNANAEISYKNFTVKSSKNIVVDLIRYAIENIISTRNVVIREIPGMSGDIIKSKLIEAYKSLQAASTKIIAYSGESEDLLTTLLLDPVYKYFYLVNMISSNKAATDKFDMVDKIDYIMGGPISAAEKYDNVFDHVRLPNFGKFDLDYFDNIKPIMAGKIDGTYIKAMIGYIARSFDIFYEKIKNKLYMEPMYVDTAINSTDIMAMDVKFREPFELHQQHYDILEEKERQLLKYKLMEFAKCWTYITSRQDRRWSRPTVSLGRIYDEDGSPHIFNIYIVETSPNQHEEIKTAAIAKSIEAGIKFAGKIVDKKCSTCGILSSAASSLDETKITESLNARNTVNNFFRFYENRCPVGGLHDFASDDKCIKCSIQPSFILSTSKDAMIYYKKYKNIYIKERDEFANPTIVSSVQPPKPPTINYGPEYEKWTFNFNSVLLLANRLKINHRLLSALGATEKQEYADVQSGAYIPPNATSRSDTRIYIVNSHIKNLITEYNQIRYFHKILKPSSDLANIINNSGINKYKLADLEKSLPMIYNDYDNRFNHIQRHKRPQDIVAFTIESFCNMCLVVLSDTNAETEKLRHSFINYFVKKILRNEEMLTKPGHFNWSVLYGDKEYKEKDSYDMNMVVDDESEPNDDEIGDTAQPFSKDGFDVEDDDDDSDNDITLGDLGESIGLD